MNYTGVLLTFFTTTSKSIETNSSIDYYTEESMGYITMRQRSIFFAFFLLLYIAAIIGNSAAIFTTCKRKHRYIQKTLIISLALSDLIMASAYAIQYLNTFAHALLYWTMGEAMCFVIPFFQLFGVSASSGAIVIIALDRYRSAVHATMKRWNPNLWISLLGILLLWSIATGLAYPTQIIIQYKRVVIVSENESGNKEYLDAHICIASTSHVRTYYICIIIVAFLPLLIIVLWLYYNICKLVYKQDVKKKDFDAEEHSDNHTIRGILKNNNNNESLVVSQRPTFQAQRKIRIFKLMIFVILTFVVCRSPHWIYTTIGFNYTSINNQEWITVFVLGSLVFLNCILNPFLYTFLPQTVKKMSKIWKTITEFTCEVCCCCCSNSEFEQFEKENPFSVEHYHRDSNPRIHNQTTKNHSVKFGSVVTSVPKGSDRY